MALVIRAQYNNRPYMSLDLSMLPSELQPLKVVDQAQLDQDQVQNIFADTSPPGSDDDNRPQSFMVGQGQVPLFLGQPLAILIFENTTVYARAKRLLQFNNNVVTYGPVVDLKLPDQPYQWPVYLTRYADYFSQTEVGTSNPYACSEDQVKLAQQHAAKGSLEAFRKDLESVAVDCAARAWRIRIDREMETAAERDWQVYRSQTSTQVLDPMFMEPEAGLAW